MDRSTIGVRGNSVDTRKDTENKERPMSFLRRENGQQTILANDAITYNPSTETLTVPNITAAITGNASHLDLTLEASSTNYFPVMSTASTCSNTAQRPTCPKSSLEKARSPQNGKLKPTATRNTSIARG